MKRSIEALLFAGAVLAIPAVGSHHHALTEQFQPVRTEWYRGEPVALRYSVCNETDTVQTPCQVRCDVRIEILDAADALVAETLPGGCGAACSFREWQPGECSTRIIKWPATDGQFGDGVVRGNPVAPGRYYAVMGGPSDQLITGGFRLLDAPVPIPAWSLLGGLVLIASLSLAVVARKRRAR